MVEIMMVDRLMVQLETLQEQVAVAVVETMKETMETVDVVQMELLF